MSRIVSLHPTRSFSHDFAAMPTDHWGLPLDSDLLPLNASTESTRITQSAGTQVRGTRDMAQKVCNMKNVRNGSPQSVAADQVAPTRPFSEPKIDALHMPKTEIPGDAAPKNIDLPEAESFRDFINSRLPRHTAPMEVLHSIRSSIQKEHSR